MSIVPWVEFLRSVEWPSPSKSRKSLTMKKDLNKDMMFNNSTGQLYFICFFETFLFFLFLSYYLVEG